MLWTGVKGGGWPESQSSTKNVCPRSGKGEEWRKYEQRYPEMKTKEIFMSNDEYAYTGGQTDLKLALAYLPVVQWAISQSVFQRRVMK